MTCTYNKKALRQGLLKFIKKNVTISAIFGRYTEYLPFFLIKLNRAIGLLPSTCAAAQATACAVGRSKVYLSPVLTWSQPSRTSSAPEGPAQTHWRAGVGTEADLMGFSCGLRGSWAWFLGVPWMLGTRALWGLGRDCPRALALGSGLRPWFGWIGR